MATVPAQNPRSLPTLASELRITVTAILGYLDLMAEENGQTPIAPQERSEWTRIVERRAGALRRLSDELLEACAEAQRPPAQVMPLERASRQDSGPRQNRT